EDVVGLVDLVLGRITERQRRPVIGISAVALKRLVSYSWPGNVRELINVLDRAVALCDHDTLLPEDLDFPSAQGDLDAFLAESLQGSISLDEMERVYVRRVLESRGGNKADAARALGINRRTLYRKLGSDITRGRSPKPE